MTKQREKLKSECECDVCLHLHSPGFNFRQTAALHFPPSTAHGIQKNHRPHLHGGVSEGVPEAFPGAPHHTIVIPALVIPIAVELPIEVGCMASADERNNTMS